MAEGRGRFLLQTFDQPRDFGVAIRAETVREHRQRILAAPQLAKDLGMGHHAAPGLACGPCLTTGKDRLRPFEVADARQREGLVIHHEALHPGLFAQAVESLYRGGDIARPHMRPSLHQPADPRADGRGIAFKQGHVIALFRQGGHKGHLGHLALGAEGDHIACQRQRLVHPPEREIGQHRAFHQFDVLRVPRQRFGVVPRGLGVVAVHGGMTPRQIGACDRLRHQRRRQADAKRRNAGET